MNKSDSSHDAFADSIFRQIDPKVRATLTNEQTEAIVSALQSNNFIKRHRIDIRGVIPLFFARYYFVFLMGRDRRTTTLVCEDERRNEGLQAGKLLVYAILMAPIFISFLIFLYLLKSALGIDIFPDKHLIDFFRF